MTVSVDTNRLTGVTRTSTYLAMASTQGGRTVYSVRIPLFDLDVILPVPDPEVVDADNRKVSYRHAKDFGTYINKMPTWAAPALLVRDSGGCHFDPLPGANNGEVGYLTVPWQVGGTSSMLTIDGQHRILGIHLEIKRLTNDHNNIERDLGKAKSEQRIAKLTDQREDLSRQLERLKSEHLGVDIYVERDTSLSRQMFVDVADNAKGISAAVRSRFDSSKAVNRTLDDVIRHALLQGRVDMEQDRMTRNNPNLIGAKHVADLTRGVVAGIGGRISRKREKELSDELVIESVNGFLDCITEAFSDLAAISEGTLTPSGLRDKSLLGSSGMLRVLAGVYNKLRDKGAEDGDITEFFRTLDPHMAAPVTEDSIWRRDPKVNQSFEVGAFAPVMRTQNLHWIVEGITTWYTQKPAFLAA